MDSALVFVTFIVVFVLVLTIGLALVSGSDEDGF